MHGNTGALLNRLNYSLALAGTRCADRVRCGDAFGCGHFADPKVALNRAVEMFLGGEAARGTLRTLEKQIEDPQIVQAKLDDPVKRVDMGVVAGLCWRAAISEGADLKSLTQSTEFAEKNGQAKKATGRKKGRSEEKLNTEGTEGRAQSSQRRRVHREEAVARGNHGIRMLRRRAWAEVFAGIF